MYELTFRADGGKYKVATFVTDSEDTAETMTKSVIGGLFNAHKGSFVFNLKHMKLDNYKKRFTLRRV